MANSVIPLSLRGEAEAIPGLLCLSLRSESEAIPGLPRLSLRGALATKQSRVFLARLCEER